MTRKIVVHYSTKRFIQIAGAALLIAATLTGLKNAAVWWNAPSDPPPVTTESGRVPNLNESLMGLIVGRSSVIDADTLEIHGVRIRLEGIDAVESAQRCGFAGQEWACGQKAALALSDWLGERSVTCNPKGQDRYQRTLARCFVGTEDVQAWLVLSGWALAYREYSIDYVSAEEVAQARQAGLWHGEFVPPWEWRRSRRSTAP